MAEVQSILAQYRQQGFALWPAFASDEEVVKLKTCAQLWAQRLDIPAHAHFATGADAAIRDRYFLDSATCVRGFFEPAAFDAQGKLKVPQPRAINKIGHALHLLDPVCRSWSIQSKVIQLVRLVGLVQPQIVQSQFIFKPPHVGGQVDLHMDSTFLYTDPPSCMGLWLALDEATVENGCLMVIPGSHRQAVPKRYVRRSDNSLTFVSLTPSPPHWDPKDCEPIPARPGDLVLLHGQVVHASAPNTSHRPRLAFVLHLIDGQAHWPTDNWMASPPILPLL